MRNLLPFLSLLIIHSAVFATERAPLSETHDELKRLSKSLPANLTLDKPLGPAEFCRVSGFRDTVGDSATSNESVANSWYGTFNPAADHRMQVLTHFIQEKEITLAASAEPMTAGAFKTCENAADKLKIQPIDQAEDVKATLLQSAYFCKDLTLSQLLPCSRAMQEMIEISKPRNDINLIDVWLTVLKQSSYMNVMKRLALKNYKRVKEKNLPQSRFFEDLVSEFRSEGLSAENANDASFNVLGVLSSNGNNSYFFTPCKIPETVQNVILLLSLSTAVLDSYTASQGFLYSYPREVNSVCDYGKNYHFWMAAFLAREGVKISHNVTASAAAAFTLDKGYQFMKKRAGRDPNNAFVLNPSSDYINNMRLDMTLAAAGAWYGAWSGAKQTKTLSREQFETGLRKMFANVPTVSPNPKIQFPGTDNSLKLSEAYSVWKKILNPDAAFRYFEGEMSK